MSGHPPTPMSGVYCTTPGQLLQHPAADLKSCACAKPPPPTPEREAISYISKKCLGTDTAPTLKQFLEGTKDTLFSIYIYFVFGRFGAPKVQGL